MTQTPAPGGASSAAAVAMRQGRSWRQSLSASAIWIVLVVLIIFAYVVSPAFLSPRNIGVLLKQAAPLGILAVGQTLVILTGGIDLSVASLMAAVSIFAAGLVNGRDERVVPVVLICLVFSILVGLANGLMVTKLKIPPFIATLGMILIVQGIRFVYSRGAPKTYIPDSLRFFGRDSLGPIPMALIVWFVIVVIVTYILHRTTFGRRLYATGGNSRTAYLSGVDVDGVKIAAYTACSLLAGIAGLILVGYVGTADNWLGLGYELNAIAAVVIGGTVFEGGKGGQLGTIGGVLILTVLFNLVLMLQFDEEARRIVKGLVILSSVALYARLRARSE
ncbi:MAG TPA: ABC transporter permease [Anaerolineales bacterium]|nr:ABC transporter permease [Anaerolineales bacterium]